MAQPVEEPFVEEEVQEPLPVEPDVSEEPETPEVPEDMIIARDVYFGTVVNGQEQIESAQRRLSRTHAIGKQSFI